MILNNMKYNKVPLHLYINAMNAMRLNRLFECVDDKGCTNKIKLNIADRRMFEYFTFFPEIDSFFRVYSSLYFFPFRAFPCPLNRQNRFNGARLLWTSNPFMKVFTSDDGRIDFST